MIFVKVRLKKVLLKTKKQPFAYTLLKPTRGKIFTIEWKSLGWYVGGWGEKVCGIV